MKSGYIALAIASGVGFLMVRSSQAALAKASRRSLGEQIGGTVGALTGTSTLGALGGWFSTAWDKLTGKQAPEGGTPWGVGR
jgi:hypothetical protein